MIGVSPKRVVYPACLIGALLAAGLLAGCWTPSRLDPVQALESPERSLRGRIHGELRHRPFDGYRILGAERSASAADWAALREIEREIEADMARDAGWRALNDHGILRLILGDHDLAIASLQAAAEKSARSGPYSDLAVAYLARFEVEGRPLDLLLAAEAADAALALNPRSTAALYNRALTLAQIGLSHGAAAAWQTYRDVETDPAWLQEAANVQPAGDRATVAARWNREQSRLDGLEAGHAAVDIGAIVADFPFHARLYAEETLLPRWARQVAEDPEKAAVRLALAGRIGAALERQRGEGLTHDAVRAADRVWRGGSPDQRRLLVEGLGRFEDGLAAYRAQATTQAEELFRRAAEDLARTANPMAGWAKFYSAVCRRYEDGEAGHAALEDLLAEIPEERYPSLAGRAHWILGTAEKVRGQVQSSVHRSERARKLLARGSGTARAAFVDVLLAESFSMLGKHDLGWEHRHRAFQAVPAFGDPRREVAMWTEAALALRRHGALHLAGPLLDEAVAVAREWGQPIGLCSAYFHRAEFRLAIGDERGAFEDIEASHRANADMELGGLRDLMHDLTLVIEGLLYRESRPRRAVTLLSEAFARQESTGYQFSLIDHLTARASAFTRLGDVGAAEADLERAIGIFEQIRSTVENPFSRMEAFRVAQPAFESLVKLRLDTGRDDPGALFEMTERARARVLLELLRGRDREGRGRDIATLAELEEALPEDTVVAEYMVLPDRVLCWVLEPGATRLLELATGPEEIRRRLESLLLELKRKAHEGGIRDGGAVLYDALIRPLSLPDREDTTLVVVPDRFLSRMPWPALFDRGRVRYLIEERPLSVLPSATLLLHVLERAGQRRGETPSILAVGVSEAAVYENRYLESLPHAGEEASAVAREYPPAGAEVLTGPDATRDAFLARSLQFNVFHFAGHALADPEVVTRSVLLFQPGGDADDGALALSEVFELDLGRSQLVVLSACRTLQGMTDDREALLGLGGAFLAAGVPAVVASQWDVRDRFAAELMPLFHRRFAAGESAGEALRQSVLSLISIPSDPPASPADWANFIVLGGIGR